MIKSMTGYGKKTVSSENYDIQVEIKSVNHRFLDLNFRMPSGYNELEMKLRENLKKGLSRGSVTVFVNISIKPGADTIKTIDITTVKYYKEMLDKVSEELRLEKISSVDLLLKFQDIYTQQENQYFDMIVDDSVVCFGNALKEIISYREKEGANLQDELKTQLEILSGIINEVDDLASSAAKIQFDKLLERLNKMASIDSFSKDRLEQELVIISDKVNISEEITRLRSHIDLFKTTMDEDKAVGKVLNNLSQEMHREASTISAKTNMTEISHFSVQMKEIIEIIREQVQNVE